MFINYNLLASLTCKLIVNLNSHLPMQIENAVLPSIAKHFKSLQDFERPQRCRRE